MANYRDFLKQVKEQVRRTTIDEVRDRLARGERIQFLDVREDDETKDGILPGAVTLSRAHFESRVEDVLPDKTAEVVIYCASGQRSAFAARTLGELGYTNAVSLDGGFNRWKDLGYDYDVPKALSSDQRHRYSRHILLPEVGQEGQLKLLESKVLLIGAGGLGSPAGLYLAAAGVGTIGIVDDDVVEESNLQRQVIHDADTLGELKAESAKARIQKLNKDVKVITHPVRLNTKNVAEIISGYDVVVDGSDNFDTRYALNDAAVPLRIPVVHGSIFRFEGMVSTFVPYDGPCYRCLYPEPPPPELAPSCSEAGVLGVLPGIVGCLQANEALKLIIGYGEPLMGRLLTFDAHTTRFGEVKARRDPSCPTCGEGAAQAVKTLEGAGTLSA
ncbi:MAG: sulfur-carrier protein adenylyltransferase/sulfurtransferase [Actinomycetota bacterium]|jgi:molybdopterin/thiamine biosynthesis adenylyltransferase/rhodanese-related sulfurtransferase|nr:sulfur-carrier protein adenylyltransferase/sulfurtransferase [Actinomycetota bacterium]